MALVTKAMYQSCPIEAIQTKIQRWLHFPVWSIKFSSFDISEFTSKRWRCCLMLRSTKYDEWLQATQTKIPFMLIFHSKFDQCIQLRNVSSIPWPNRSCSSTTPISHCEIDPVRTSCTIQFKVNVRLVRMTAVWRGVNDTATKRMRRDLMLFYRIFRPIHANMHCTFW